MKTRHRIQKNSITRGGNEQVMIFQRSNRMLVHPNNNRGKIRLNNEFLPKNPLLEENNSRALITISVQPH
jgi:hypothetical protein